MSWMTFVEFSLRSAWLRGCCCCCSVCTVLAFKWRLGRGCSGLCEGSSQR